MHIMVHNIYILFIFIIENNERSVLNLDLKYELYELNLSFKISFSPSAYGSSLLESFSNCLRS